MKTKTLQELSSVSIKGVKVPIIFEQNSSLPLISMQLIIKVAGKIENKNIAGLSNFCARMFAEGTKNLGSQKFAKNLEDRAINLNAYNGTETFIFALGALKEEFSHGLGMLKELLEEPNLTAQSFKNVQSFTLGRLSEKKSDFDYVASGLLTHMLYKNSPLAFANLGDEKSIENLTLKDVKSFIKEHIDLANATIVIGGDLSLDSAKEHIKTLLSSLPKGKKRELLSVETSNAKEVKVLQKPTEQAYIYFGSPFYQKNSDKDSFKTKVAGFILGASGFGSRLMEEIRVKRGLAYSAYGKIEVANSHSVFSGFLQTKNENKDKAIAIVKEVVETFVEIGVTQAELDQAKRFLLGSEPLRNETLSQRLSKAFHEVYEGFHLGYQQEQLEMIRHLSLNELNGFIKSHKEIKNLSFAVVTNEK